MGNRIPYLDPKCPTLPICWALKALKWQGVEKKIVHVSADIGEFDSYEAVKAKTYFQVLYKLKDCIRLASSIPSRQPVLFYSLLLLGQRVEPGLGCRRYKELYKALMASGKAPVLELEDIPDDIVPEPLPDNDDVVVPYGDEPPPPKRRKTQGPSTGGGSSSGSGGPPVAPGPPPPVLAAPPPPIVDPPSVEPPIGCPGYGGDVMPPYEENDDILVPVEEEPAPEPERRRRANRRDVGWKDGLGGLRVRFDGTYATPDDTAFTANYQIKCNQHAGRCIKKRHVTAGSTAACGEIEVLAFLHVWAAGPVIPGKSHSNSPPDQAEVVAYAEDHREELEELVRVCNA